MGGPSERMFAFANGAAHLAPDLKDRRVKPGDDAEEYWE